jgi:hypothetical protein
MPGINRRIKFQRKQRIAVSIGIVKLLKQERFAVSKCPALTEPVLRVAIPTQLFRNPIYGVTAQPVFYQGCRQAPLSWFFKKPSIALQGRKKGLERIVICRFCPDTV